MIKHSLLVIILVFYYQMMYGQETRDSIELRMNKWGNLVPRYQGRKINSFHPYKDYRKIMQYDPEATKYLKRSKRFLIAGLAVEYTGIAAFLILESNRVPVNSSSYGRIDPNLIPFAVAISLVTSPFLVHSGRNRMKAITTCNSNLHKTGLRSIKLEYYFTIKGTSIGLAVKF